jgi:hypothetical protein
MKYTILNTNTENSTFCIDNLLYIILFILVAYLAMQYIYSNYKDNSSKENSVVDEFDETRDKAYYVK